MTDKDKAIIITGQDGAVTGFRHSMLLATMPDLPGYEIVEVLGVVRGNSVRARHVGHDIVASLRNLVGGEVGEYTKLLAESREQAIDRMVDQAESLGANAVISMHFSTSMVMASSAELLAYGTAVVAKPKR